MGLRPKPHSTPEALNPDGPELGASTKTRSKCFSRRTPALRGLVFEAYHGLAQHNRERLAWDIAISIKFPYRSVFWTHKLSKKLKALSRKPETPYLLEFLTCESHSPRVQYPLVILSERRHLKPHYTP